MMGPKGVGISDVRRKSAKIASFVSDAFVDEKKDRVVGNAFE
jgi:hypothetical protein